MRVEVCWVILQQSGVICTLFNEGEDSGEPCKMALRSGPLDVLLSSDGCKDLMT